MTTRLQTLFADLTIDGAPKRSSNVAMAECESKLGISLPDSYKEFCTLFGGGMLFRLFSIAVPDGIPNRFNLSMKHEFWRNAMSPDVVNEYCPNPDIFWRSIFFADDIRTDYYAWDTEDVTSAALSKYAVYRVRRDFTLDRLTDSFEEFVVHACAKDAQELQEDDPSENVMVFEPMSGT